jgi:hypothetical protein
VLKQEQRMISSRKRGTGYPPTWRQTARQCKEQAGWRCEQCGVAHGTLRYSKAGKLYIVYLAAAHLDHDPSNPTARLRALCQRCHMQLDATQHAQVRKERKLRGKQPPTRRRTTPNPVA